MKKIQIKIALLVLLGLAVIQSAQAQGGATYNNDLIVGFSTQSGTDTLYDLGAVSSLSNGETWNLGSLLTSYDLTTVDWGVIASVSSNHTQYLTYNPGSGAATAPSPVASFGQWNFINTAVKTIYNNSFVTAGAGKSATVSSSQPYSWNVETINPTLGTDYLNEEGGANPNAVGESTVGFFAQPDNGATPPQIGNFSLNASGVVTFNTLSAAPPMPKIVSLVRSGSTDSIYFTTTSGSFTYTLYYTNAAGLTAPITNWIASPTTLTGDGNTNSLTDTSTDANRFYRIGVH
jgi:hypothetical protein